jgi:hypothetical protein
MPPPLESFSIQVRKPLCQDATSTKTAIMASLLHRALFASLKIACSRTTTGLILLRSRDQLSLSNAMIFQELMM